MASISCSFCGTNLDKVGELYDGTDAHICKGCILEFYQDIRATQGIGAQLFRLRERGGQEINFLFNRFRYYWLQPGKASPIFILCMQRTGSSLLFDYLSHIPDSKFSFEMLNNEMSEGIRHDSPKAKVLNHIKYTIYSLNTKVLGAKFFLDQLLVHRLELADLTRLFPCAKFLLLYRKNLAEQYVSLEIARRTNEWFYYGNKPEFTETIHVDLKGLLYFAENCREKYAEIFQNKLFKQHGLAISYESVVEDFAALMVKKLSVFLGLPPWDFDSELKKRNRRPLQEIIENYDELADTLASDRVRMYI